MSFRDNKSIVITFLSGLLAGVLLSGTFMGFKSLFGDKQQTKKRLRWARENTKQITSKNDEDGQDEDSGSHTVPDTSHLSQSDESVRSTTNNTCAEQNNTNHLPKPDTVATVEVISSTVDQCTMTDDEICEVPELVSLDRDPNHNTHVSITTHNIDTVHDVANVTQHAHPHPHVHVPHTVIGLPSYPRNPFNRRENAKIIKEIDKAPLELRKRFDNKGYVFINQNLATVNTELNEFVELMRKYDLYVLNGCRDPETCPCNFRHKRCRLFMIRKYSTSMDLQFFAPSCSGVTVISPSNKDIVNETPIHEFVQMFLTKFSDRVMDLVSYVSYIIDPHRISEYVVDVTMIADPYDRSYKYSTKKGGYGQPVSLRDSSDDLLAVSRIIQRRTDDVLEKIPEQISDQISTEHTDKEKCENARDNRDNHKCSLSWHQDHFVEAKTNQTHAYDFVALFVLNANNVTPHKLMIGKLKAEIDTKDMTLDQIQEHIIPLTDSLIDENTSDIGYVIDQRKRYFHKHSDFEHLGADSRRNVITIRIKHLK